MSCYIDQIYDIAISSYHWVSRFNTIKFFYCCFDSLYDWFLNAAGEYSSTRRMMRDTENDKRLSPPCTLFKYSFDIPHLAELSCIFKLNSATWWKVKSTVESCISPLQRLQNASKESKLQMLLCMLSLLCFKKWKFALTPLPRLFLL